MRNYCLILILLILLASCLDEDENKRSFPVGFDISALDSEQQGWFMAAAQEWNDGVGWRIFYQDSSSDNSVVMEPNLTFDGEFISARHDYFGFIHTILFNASVVWSICPVISVYDFQTTSLHELGHAIGLEHNLDPNSIMYSVVHTPCKHLSTKDIALARIAVALSR